MRDRSLCKIVEKSVSLYGVHIKLRRRDRQITFIQNVVMSAT